MKRTHLAAVLLLPFAAVSLSGCFNGLEATTNVQSTMNSGNGVQVRQGDIRIENTTLVMDETGATALLVRLFNEGPVTDALTYATVNGQQVEIITPEGNGAELQPGASVSFGWDSDNSIAMPQLDVPISSYVPVELGFAEAGLASVSVLTVPQTGYYADVVVTP